jgi:hypothetical protein
VGDKVFKTPAALGKIYADGSGGVGLHVSKDGKRSYVYGTTIAKGLKYNVHLSSAAFKSNAFLTLTIQHEYAHVYMSGNGHWDDTDIQEIEAYGLSVKQAELWGMQKYVDEYNRQLLPRMNYFRSHNYNTSPRDNGIEWINQNYLIKRIPQL